MTFRNTYSIISHLVQQTQQLLENFHENSAAMGLVFCINTNTFIWTMVHDTLKLYNLP